MSGEFNKVIRVMDKILDTVTDPFMEEPKPKAQPEPVQQQARPVRYVYSRPPVTQRNCPRISPRFRRLQ